MPRALALAATVVATAAGWWLLLPAVPAAQPIAFNHARHAAVACVVCHSGVEVAARAGLPSGAFCAKCHATAPAGAAAARWDGLQAAGLAWIRVTRLPTHVMFSHRRHVAIARFDCASCHGDIGSRATPPLRAPVRLDMNTCLGCHRQEDASEDCAACHR